MLLQRVKEAVVDDNGPLQSAGAYAELLSLLQIAQRSIEANNLNLSDAVFTFCELLDRVSLLDDPLITEEMKKKTLDCIHFRFDKLYTNNMALAVMSDARRQFSVDNNVLRLLPEFSWREDAFNCLKKRIEVLPDAEQPIICRAYSNLVAGKYFDFSGKDEMALADADNMPQFQWWNTYRENGGADLCKLSECVLERLFSITPAQAGVERLNSQFRFIQAGRQALASENSRYLTFLYVNRRVLTDYHKEALPASGSFALGARWPLRTASKVEAALDDAVDEAIIEKEQVGIAKAIAALEADELAEQEGAVAGPRKRSSGATEGAAGAAATAGKKRKARADHAGKPLKPAARKAAKGQRAARRNAVALTSCDEGSDGDTSDGSSDSDYSLHDDSDADAEPERPPPLACPRCCFPCDELDEFGRCGRKPMGKSKCKKCTGCRRPGCLFTDDSDADVRSQDS